MAKFTQLKNKNTQLEKEISQLQTQVMHLQRVSEEQQHRQRKSGKTLGLGSPVTKAPCDATSVSAGKRQAARRIQQTLQQDGGVNSSVKNSRELKPSRQNNKRSTTLRATQVRTERICDPNVKKTNAEEGSPQKYILKDVAPSTKNVRFIDPHGKILRVGLNKVVALDHEGLVNRLRSLWQDNKTQRSLPLSLCVARLSAVPEGGWKVAWIDEANRASDVFTELSSLVDLGWHILPQLESLPDHGQQYASQFQDLFRRSFAEQNGEELKDFQAKFVNLDIGDKPSMQ
ncbi:hypothetical protein Brms1b_013788 [Colletotrichum noveboracense]|nr:hypothetical protein Brms1b_013788 [Colletotrichum noveboracense]